ncbi:MAG: hypothetical protein IGR93_16595 [Hydrococcus sp. C42_A2020_068]|nr:hypothetical protein [Hydrococcus sp. C42_A2020_068]
MTTTPSNLPRQIAENLTQLLSSWQFCSNSIGTRLFLYVLGSAAIGLAALSYSFYQTLVRGAQAEIQNSLSTQVKSVEAQLAPVEQQVRSLSGAANVLHRQGIKTPSAYEQLAFSALRQGSKLLTGIGLGQTPRAIVPDRQWFFPFYYFDKKVAGQKGKRLPAPDGDVIYSELFADDNYPNQDYYATPVASGKASWFEPYGSYGALIATYAAPIFDRQQKIIGVVNADVDFVDVTQQIANTKVTRNAGYFTILSAQGRIVAYPPAPPIPPKNLQPGPSAETVPELKPVWSSVRQGLASQTSGLLAIEGKYWAYQKIPSTGWVMLAAFPQGAIVTPAILTSIGAALIVTTLLGIVVLLFVRNLNRRLQPILDECNKLAADAQTQAKLQGQDEIGRLSASFFNLLAQLEANQAQIRQEASLRVQIQERQRQALEAESQVLQEDVGQLLEVVAAVEEGDLTVQAPVSDRVTGLVADTFNRLVEQLARIMAVVSSTAQQVTQSAETLEQFAVQTVSQVRLQTRSVEAMQALLQNIRNLTRDNAKQTQTANKSIQQAQEALVRGQRQMTQLTAEIDTLDRGTVQIVRRMQTLSDFVQLAVQFAKDQKRIASMTRVLALNAALLSTRATEQQDPDQFASIAREFEAVAAQVNDLAVQTSQSLIILQQRTEQIQTVVSGLNQDAEEIERIVKDFATGVEQSRQVFDEIRTATVQVARVGQQVTQSSQAIADAARDTLKSIREIAALASDTERQASITREQSEAMGQLAGNLDELVRFFRIAPEQMQTGSAAKILRSANDSGSPSNGTQPDPMNNENKKVTSSRRKS